MKKLIVFGMVYSFLLTVPVNSMDSSEFIVATNDGLSLTLNENGFVESLKIEDNELVDEPSQAFLVRDFTPDHEIENLVFNPGFEDDSDGDAIADGWQPYSISGEMDISLDETNTHIGSKSVKMFANSSSQQNKMAYISSSISVKGDTEYMLSVFAMNDFGFLEDWWTLSMYVYCVFYDEQEEEIGQEELQLQHTLKTWKQFSKIIESPSNAEKAEIRLVFNGPKYMTQPGAESSTAWFDDICLYEMPEGTKITAVNGALKKEGNKLIYEGTFEGLNFCADYESKEDYIEINGKIENDGSEKALDVYFLLPLNMQGWKWWDDIRNPREIGDGIYEMTINADESSYLSLSTYPASAITSEVGLSIAIPLSKPRIFRIFYDSTIKKFGISFSFGLSPLTKFQNVDFTVYLYKCDAEWGFRDAIKKYYNFFPEYFEKSISQELMNSSGEFADFGVRSVQGQFHNENYAKHLPELNEKNIYACEYTLPSAFEPKSLQSINEPSPDYEEFLNLIDYYAEYGNSLVKMKAEGAKHSTVSDINGDSILDSILRGQNWAPDSWVGRFPLNADPDLPDFSIAEAMMETLIKPAFENAEKYDALLNGVQLDNFMKISRHIDMNESRFQYADTPLTYSPNNFKPGIHVMSTMVEYLMNLSDWLSENEKHAKITGNCIERGIALFGFPYLAALPFEMSSLTDWNFDDTELNYRRSMAYHRLVLPHQCGKMCNEFGIVVVSDVEDFINESIFYGMYPIMKDDFFENCSYEVVRSLYKKMIPIVDELHNAGWEPITHAKTDDEKVFVERFGEGDNLYVTVRNTDSVARNFKLTIEAEELSVGDNPNLREMLSNTSVSYEYENGSIVISDYIDAYETKIFTTQVASSTTTTTSPGPCLAESIYGEYSEETELLRDFRNNVLNKSLEGHEIIRLYYQWSPSLVEAIRKDKEFKEDIITIMDGILPMIDNSINYSTVDK